MSTFGEENWKNWKAFSYRSAVAGRITKSPSLPSFLHRFIHCLSISFYYFTLDHFLLRGRREGRSAGFLDDSTYEDHQNQM